MGEFLNWVEVGILALTVAGTILLAGDVDRVKWRKQDVPKHSPFAAS